MSGLVTAATAGGSGLSEIAFTGIVLKAVVFLGITVGIGHYLSGTLLRRGARMSPGMLIVVGLATCFALAFVAERVGLAGIIGAFAAGLMLDPYGEGVHTAAEETTLSTLLSPISSVFVPLFFVLMGIQVDLGSLFTPQTVTFGGVLVLVAVVGKLASAAGVVARGIDRLTVGIGMVPRGEVGLIFAGIGAALSLDGRPLLSQATFSALVLMVVLTTLLTPSSLRWALRRAATTSRT
jgi:Kef-type K+ transport system membrane component KefB